MKNLKVNLKNEPAAPGEKLITFHFVGGASVAAVVCSIVLEILFVINLLLVIKKMFGGEPFPNGTLWVALSSALVALGFFAVAAAIVVRAIIYNRYGNRGFEIYTDKIVFTQELPNDLKINKRSIPARVIISLFISFYIIYWMYLQVKNTRAIKHERSSCIGEMLLLLFVPFYSYYWFYTRGELIRSEFRKRGYSVASRGWLYLLFSLLGLSFVAIAMMQNDFNNIPEDTFSKEAPEPEEDSYSFDEVDRIYIQSRSLYVEAKGETRRMPLNSRDFRWDLDFLLKYNGVNEP